MIPRIKTSATPCGSSRLNVSRGTICGDMFPAKPIAALDAAGITSALDMAVVVDLLGKNEFRADHLQVCQLDPLAGCDIDGEINSRAFRSEVETNGTTSGNCPRFLLTLRLV